MFVPVITKDMQLFPNGKTALPARIKNVRSRAQSLEDFASSAVNRNGVSASTASVAVARARIAPNHQRQRNSQSVGSLQMANGTLVSPPAKSSSVRRPLDAIAEGVEMPATAKKKANPLIHLKNQIQQFSISGKYRILFCSLRFEHIHPRPAEPEDSFC